MPRWICRTCHAVMQVDTEMLGQYQRCARCGRESEVIDSDAVTTAQTSPPAGLLPPQLVSHNARSLLIVLTLLPFIMGGVMLGLKYPGGFHLLCLGVGMLVNVVLVWPFYTMADDTRANRIILERIALELKQKQ
jgi:hypothetical protein